MEPDWLKQAREKGLEITEQGVDTEFVGHRFKGDPPASEIVKEAVKIMSEAEFQRAVIDLAHYHGWTVAHFRKVRVQRAGGETYWETPVAADGKGFLDLLMLKGTRLIVAELKVGRNALTPEQERWAAKWLEFGGAEVYTWRPDEWTDIVETLGRE